MSTVYNMGPSPHIRTSETVSKVMLDVIIALMPAMAVAVYVFGIKALITPAFLSILYVGFMLAVSVFKPNLAPIR